MIDLLNKLVIIAFWFQMPGYPMALNIDVCVEIVRVDTLEDVGPLVILRM